jgi:uncharacterized protein (TIGR02001 family)
MTEIGSQEIFMRSTVIALALAATFSSNAFAEEHGADDSLLYMMTIASDYRFRGISQTRLDPALQGSVDYNNHATGLYVGTWLLTIKWIKDMGGNANVEWDIYGGKKGEIVKDVSYDVGMLSYIYLPNDMGNIPGFSNTNANIYGQLGYGPAYVKYTHAVAHALGLQDSKNSSYLDVGANIDVESGLILNLHAGHQTIKNNSASSYSDWKVGMTKNFSRGLLASLAVYGTNTDSYRGPAPVMKNLGKPSLVLSVTKMFM